jgi:hypothetical protein
MARPKRRFPVKVVQFNATPALLGDLEAVIEEQNYGLDLASVAKTLVVRGIEDLIEKRVILPRRERPTRKPGRR